MLTPTVSSFPVTSVAIIGASGYTGAELVRLVLGHPRLSLKGVYAKAGVEEKGVLREIRVASDEEAGKFSPGQELTVAQIFEGVKKVSVTANAKGKGFQGVMKRHHFAGGNASHGSTAHRKPGSIGSNTYPARVFPGQRMGGRMGGGRITQKGLAVIGIEPGSHLMLVQGSVPGPLRCLVTVAEQKS